MKLTLVALLNALVFTASAVPLTEGEGAIDTFSTAQDGCSWTACKLDLDPLFCRTHYYVANSETCTRTSTKYYCCPDKS